MNYKDIELLYEEISKDSLISNLSFRIRQGNKLYDLVKSYYSPNGFLRSSVEFGEDINLEELKLWLIKILELCPHHNYAKNDLKIVELYISKPKHFERAKKRKKESEAKKIIFNKIKDCVTRKPPDFDLAHKIYVENNSDELQDEISHLEHLGKIYLEIAQKKNITLIAEAERLHKLAFDLINKENLYDYGVSSRRARFHLEGIGTEKSFTRHQGILIISFRNMKCETDKEKELKARRAYEISLTYQSKDHYGMPVNGVTDLKLALHWMEEAKNIGANNIFKFDDKFQNLKNEIHSENPEYFKQNKKTEPIESYDGQDLKYMQDILIDYFNQNKSFFGGYKTIKYSELATYLTSRHIVELREGNKAAAKLGIIRPMQIPTAVLATGPFKIEQVGGWDALGDNIYITIKK